MKLETKSKSMTDNLENIVLQPEETMKTKAPDIPDQPTDVEKPEEKIGVHIENFRSVSKIKSVVRSSDRSNDANSSHRKRVSFREDNIIINVKSYKEFNRPEYFYNDGGCCGQRCAIF